MKRAFDFLVALVGLIVLLPVFVPIMILIWSQDRHSPFYVAPRVGLGGREFRMIKFRSMIVNADKSGVDSTSANDRRITPIGQFVRRYKLDELPQLWNVLKGDMSLVGPRPNVKRETDLYTDVERRLLTVRPGITDLSSIVFSDEGEILADSKDPDLDYNQLIRPWKSRLGIVYVDHHSLLMDLRLIFATALAIVSRERALGAVGRILASLNADPKLIEIAARNEPLTPYPPPGASKIVTSRDGSVA